MKDYRTRGYAALIAVSLLTTGAQADGTISYVDLEPIANRLLEDSLGSGTPGNNLATLPQGVRTLGGIRFKIGPGLIQLGSTMLQNLPDKVENIPVDRRFDKLHFLHATCFGGGPNQEGDPGWVKDGTRIGQYIVRYEDGGQEAIPIVYGEDVRDWFYVDGEKEPSRGKVVWKGDNHFASQVESHLRLYATSWTNPKPDKKVVRIDYVSRKDDTPAAPFCIAISMEKK